MPHVDELHTQHDPILMVSLASGDLAPADRDYATAQSLRTSCTECARLHDDVVAIARATKVLPPVARTRDFRITDEQAAKLRPGGLRGLLGRLATGPLLSRQLGAGLATLGIAGLLITAGPTLQLGGFASSGAAASQPAAAAPAPGSAFESFSAGGAAAEALTPAAAPSEVTQPYSGPRDTSGGGASPVTQVDTSGLQAPGASDGNSTRNNANPSPAAAAEASPDRLAMAPTPPEDVSSPPTNVVTTNDASVLGIVSVVLLVTGVLLLLARRFVRGQTSI
jgi:hypothetical protein